MTTLTYGCLFTAALFMLGCSKSPAQKEEESRFGSEYSWDEAKVKDVQLALMYAGYGLERVDGYIGPGTREAVRAFQRVKGVAPSGYLGDETWGAIEAAKTRDGPRDIDAIQKALKGAGFDPGHLDGVLGAGTREQIIKFQEKSGLRVTGSIDPATWARLGEQSARVGGEKVGGGGPR